MSGGRLLLVPNTLDLGAEPVDIQQLLPLGVLQCAAGLSHWLAEDARSTRAFLKRVHAVVPLGQPLQACCSEAKAEALGGWLQAAADELRDWVKARLRSSRVPERVEFVAELPYNETGKLLRRKVRETLGS